MELPYDVKYILDTFHNNGYEAFIVGGCVRDFLLNKLPKDYDITTNALPEQIIELFDKTIPTGIRHGTITVILNNTNYEVTTYRIDGDYIDNRKPENVKFVSNIKEDLSRRDFTINAMAYSSYLGFKDYFDGKKDLEKKLIKCVGKPNIRFQEDALRMLRAIRFSCQLNFHIHTETLNSIKNKYTLINNISTERIRDEFSKILLSDYPSKGLSLLKELNILNSFLPEINNLKDFNCYDLYDDIHDNYKLLDILPKKLHIRLAGLFYKIKNLNNIEDFCKTILKKLRYDNKTIKNTCILVKEMNNVKSRSTLKSLKKLINRTSKDLIFDLLSLEKGYLAFYDEYSTEYIDIIEDNIKEILRSKEPLCLKDLAIHGEDLLKDLNLKSGKNIGILLNFLLDNVLESPELNTKEHLINLSKQFMLSK